MSGQATYRAFFTCEHCHHRVPSGTHYVCRGAVVMAPALLMLRDSRVRIGIDFGDQS